MLAKPKKFIVGLLLMVAFLAVLVLMFLPLYGGMNALDYMDALYNSISKGSADYIGDLEEKASVQNGNRVELVLDMGDETRAGETALLFEAAGADVEIAGTMLTVRGDLGAILGRCLEDSTEMYANDGDSVRSRYGYEEKRALYNWWGAMKEMDKALKGQQRFAEAAVILTIKKKAVECAYNYYGIEPQSITDKIGIVLFSLIFYVVYTVWYGYAIIFMFEGWGLDLSH